MTLRVFLLLSCALLIHDSVQAQVEVGGVYFPSITVITPGDNDENPYVRNKLTFAGGAGATFAYNFSESLALSTGLLYASHNQKFDAYATIRGEEFKIYAGKKRLDYLKVPILCRYTSSSNGPLKFYGFAGPQLSFLLKGDGAIVVYKHFDPDYPGYYFDLPPAESSYYNGLLVELSAGGGIEYPLTSNLHFQGALKFDVALNNTENKGNFDKNFYDKTTVVNDGHNTRNYSVNLMMGVAYRVGGKHDLVKPGGGRGRRPVKYKR